MTTLSIDVAALTQKLARRESLDVAMPVEVRRAAATALIERAAAALSPAARNPNGVLAALAQLETLARLPADDLARAWLALRALDLRPGETVGGTLAADAVVATLAQAAGYVVTLDPGDVIAGAVGSTGARTAFAARARTVVPGQTGVAAFTVNAGDAVLLAGQPGDAAATLLAAIEVLPSRRDSQVSTVATVGVPAIEYEVIDPQARDTLSGDILFEPYVVARLRAAWGQAHPSPLVESAALASVVPPAPRYRPHLRRDLMEKGALSLVQFERVVYAGQAHEQFLDADPDDPNGTPPRRGYFLGDAMGVGKGRTVAAIIMDGWNQGRRRAVWISERGRLSEAAKRDWCALGGRADDLFELTGVSPDAEIPARNGILFLTFAGLRGEGDTQSRVRQIVDWLHPTTEGVIVFDEAHNLRNATPMSRSFGGQKPSAQGEAALELQRMCPNARVVYASATGATDINALGFAVRLGLWGRGTAFPTAKAFFAQMQEGGLNALELVARDLKAMGLYHAASLSFDGVEYDRLEHRLTAAERQLQDTMSTAWAKVGQGLRKAMEYTGIGKGKVTGGARASGIVKAQYASAKQRFFQALLASIKMGPVIEAIRKDLADGHSAVIQLANTYEATANRALAAAKDADLGDLDATPRDIILQFVEHLFPVWKQQTVKIGNKTYVTLALDANKNPIPDPRAVAERDQLMAEIRRLDIPEGPLEQLLDAFGPGMVAEVTGRRRRVVPVPGGKRTVEERTDLAIEDDIRAFQAGLKRVLVFSPSGGVGADYHASTNCTNQSLRVHYLLQPGWRADVALQGMGRTHRSNQVQPPRYVLVTTDLWADNRVLSTIANRMESMGAITRGQRHAASQGFFTSEDNLETPLATDAWRVFLTDLDRGRVPGLTLGEFEFETGIEVRATSGFGLRPDLPLVTRFLNQMAGMTVDRQAMFGSAFKQRLEEVKLAAIRDGTYDRGVETIRPDSLIILEDNVIYREPKTGAETHLIQLLRRDSVEPTTFAAAARWAADHGAFRFSQSVLTGRVSCLVFPKKGVQMDAATPITQITPRGHVQRTAGEIWQERNRTLNYEEAKAMWDAELDVTPAAAESYLFVVTGGVLPIWDKLPKERVTVYRMETDFNERLLGRVIPESYVDRLVRRMDAVQGRGIPAADALAGLERGEIVTLVNGWLLQGDPDPKGGPTVVTLDLRADDPAQYRAELVGAGFVETQEPLTGQTVFLLPVDPAARGRAWTRITEHRQVSGMTALFGA